MQQTSEDFEHTAPQELIHMALALCEKHIHSAPEPDAHSYAMASAAMGLIHAIQAFITVERLNGK
jgi:hypothetical protein